MQEFVMLVLAFWQLSELLQDLMATLMISSLY